jgi:dTDP-4-amino-4,6-dideoxygalactose transaminase
MIKMDPLEEKKISDLAIFGGTPLFDQPLHVGRPNICDRNLLTKRFNEILDNKWLSNNGPFVQELERRIEKYLGAKHCIAVCNATVGLEIAIRALDLKGEVIVPSFTFIATAHSLKLQGIDPVFCDIDPKTHNIDPKKAASLITTRTTGIVGVHVWGRPCAPEELQIIAKKHNLKLLFDAAHAFGCSHNGTKIGNFGNAEVFSFHATKFLNSFEGGAVVTNDDQLAEKIRLMKNFGFSGNDNVVCMGTNGKMNEFSAAMGLTGLENLELLIQKNYKNYQQYQKFLRGIPGIHLIEYDPLEKYNYQYLVLEIDESKTGISRDRILEILKRENILAKRYFPGCHTMEPYRTLTPDKGSELPETEKLAKTVLVLPTGTSTSENDIEQISGLIGFIIRNGIEINDFMDHREDESLKGSN